MHAGAESVPGPAQASVTALAAEQSAVMDEIDVLMEELVADTVLQNVQPELQVRLPGVETYHGEPEHQCHVSYRTMHPCLVISRTSEKEARSPSMHATSVLRALKGKASTCVHHTFDRGPRYLESA